MNERKRPPARRHQFWSTAIVMIWTITMFAVALFLMSFVVFRLAS